MKSNKISYFRDLFIILLCIVYIIVILFFGYLAFRIFWNYHPEYTINYNMPSESKILWENVTP